jgi:hypothetical protein
MKLLGKILLGILSFVPVVFFAAFFFWLIPSFFRRSAAGPSLFSTRLELLLPAAIATSVILLMLLVIYAVVLWRRPGLAVAEKVGVPVAILFSNGIILPLVWWLYVWREADLATIRQRH